MLYSVPTFGGSSGLKPFQILVHLFFAEMIENMDGFCSDLQQLQIINFLVKTAQTKAF
jgi:uncharacterized membrane protein